MIGERNQTSNKYITVHPTVIDSGDIFGSENSVGPEQECNMHSFVWTKVYEQLQLWAERSWCNPLATHIAGSSC